MEKEEVKVAKRGGKDYEPILFFGKTFSFDNSEKKLINALRTWSTANFTKNKMLTDKFITKLSEVKEKFGKNEQGKYYDFDL